MKTKVVNIFEVQQRWRHWHLYNADSIECDTQTGEEICAIYRAPMVRWKGLYQTDGTLLIPDMDYYNSLTDMEEIKSVLDELKL